MRKVLITGVCGQDGSYLAELLVSKGYEVHGTTRHLERGRATLFAKAPALAKVAGNRLTLHSADLERPEQFVRLIDELRPQEIFHLAGQSHVGKSFEEPVETVELVSIATMNILEAVRTLPTPARFLNVGSSEIFGREGGDVQDESTPLRPVSPYGVAKAFTVQMVRVYRESYGVFACNAICYNHESERRPEAFVTRKITRAAAQASLDSTHRIKMGNLDVQRDWGYAPEYANAMWLMLQHGLPDDYILSTGKLTSLQDLLELAFSKVGLDWRNHVDVDPGLVRANDYRTMIGTPRKAADLLGWKANIGVEQIVDRMLEADIAELSKTNEE